MSGFKEIRERHRVDYAIITITLLTTTNQILFHNILR